MRIKTTRDFAKKQKLLEKKNKGLHDKIDRKLRILIINPKHPSLRIHKLISNQYQAWSVSIDMQLRILFVYRAYGILLIDIGGHDEVY